MASFFGGVTQGLHAGAGLADRRRERSRERLYRDALDAGMSDSFDPTVARDIAARHGRWQDVQGYHSLASVNEQRQDKDRRRFAGQILALEQAGDFDGLNRLVSQAPPALFGLESHRKPMGVRRVLQTHGTDPQAPGEELWALDVANGKTGTRGPQTDMGGADPSENAVYIKRSDLGAYLSPWLPKKEKGERRVHHTGEGRLYDSHTGQWVSAPAAKEPKDPRSPWRVQGGFKINQETGETHELSSPIEGQLLDAAGVLDDMISKGDIAYSGQPEIRRKLVSGTMEVVNALAYNHGLPPIQVLPTVVEAFDENSPYYEALSEGAPEERRAILQEITQRIGTSFRQPRGLAGAGYQSGG